MCTCVNVSCHIMCLYIHDVLVHARLFAWIYTLILTCDIWVMVIHPMMGILIMAIEMLRNGLMSPQCGAGTVAHTCEDAFVFLV